MSTLRSLRCLLLKCAHDRDSNFRFLARDAVPPYIANRSLLVAGKPDLREYKALFVMSDQAVSRFSDEITINSAPLV